MEYNPISIVAVTRNTFQQECPNGNEQFLEIHLDERYYVGEDLELFYGFQSSNGAQCIDLAKRLHYDPDQCIDFISSYEWRKVFLTLTDKFIYIIPLIHDLPQIVYIYIYSSSPDKTEIDMKIYPKLRAIVHETSPDANTQLLQDIETFKRDLLTINVVNPTERKTKLFTIDKSKDKNSTFNQRLVENCSIIWVRDDDKEYLTEISIIENEFNLIDKFINIDQCIDHITSLDNDIQIFFISSKSNNHFITESITCSTKIRFIYIYQSEKKSEIILNQSSNKIRGVYFDINNLRDQLLEDYNQYSNDLQMSISIFDKDKNQKTLRNLHEDNAHFMWFQLLIDILIQIPHNYQTFDEMLDECEKYEMKINAKQSEKYIEDLRKNYQSNKALQYYTGDTFLYRLFNRALRTENIDFIFIFRFFLTDMYKQLHQLYIKQYLNNNNSLDLFRGQQMTIKEFNIIKSNVGNLISINQFLSTTQHYSIACLFAGFNDNNKSSNTISVLFQIEIDDTRHSLKRPFASLKELSRIEVEDEVLLCIGTVFRIENVENIPGSEQNWYVLLKLINDDVKNEISELRDDLEKEHCDNPDLTSFGCVLIGMGEYDKAERYFQMILEHIRQNHPAFPRALSCLGIIHYNRGNSQKALEYYQQSLEGYKQGNPLDPDDNIGVTYTHIGAVYTQLVNNQLALEYFDKAIKIQKLPKRISYTYNQIAIIYQNNGDYRQALEYFQKQLKIDEEILKLNKYHPTLATTYNNIGDTYGRLGEYDTALKYLQHALNIRLKGTTSTHTDLAAIYNNLGSVYEQKHCWQQALEMYEKALEIDTQALPDNHISLAITHSNIGGIYEQYGNFNTALFHIEKALEIISKSDVKNNHLYYIPFQCNFATLQINLGNYSKAVDILEKLLKVQSEMQPEVSPHLCATYLALSRAYEHQDDIPKALEYLEKSLEYARITALPTNHAKFQLIQNRYDQFKATHFNNDKKVSKLRFEQADKYDNIDEQDLLLICANEELRHISSNDIYNRIRLLSMIGTINSRRMDYEVAMETFNDAISIYNQRSELSSIEEQNLIELMTSVYYNLARLYYRLQDWSIALQNSEKSLDLALQQNEQHPLLAEIYNLLGVIQTRRKNLATAEKYHEFSIEAAKKILPDNHPDIQRYYVQLNQLQMLKQLFPYNA